MGKFVGVKKLDRLGKYIKIYIEIVKRTYINTKYFFQVADTLKQNHGEPIPLIIAKVI